MTTMQGAITDQDRQFKERWENVSPSSNTIIHLDRRGDETTEVIEGRREFFVTTEERILFQDRVRDSRYDPFTNGQFRPVLVPDSVTVETNPNALSDDEIRAVLQSSDVAWDEYMKVITSPETVRRMIDIADTDENVSLKRYKGLNARMAVLAPPRRIVQKDQDQYEKMAPSSPSGRAPRRQGGRSADYR